MLDESLLDDPARLTDHDAGGLLRAGASAGAQVRATAEAATEAGLAGLLDVRPRALVLLTRPGVSSEVAGLLAALLGASCPVPLVVADAAPTWVGALDVVVAHTEDPGDDVLAESVDRASRRGARVVLTAPEEGPVAAAAAGRAALLPSRVPVPPGFSFPRAFTAALLVVHGLDLLRTDTDVLADELDVESERDHPVHESFVNPAKSIALRLAERTPLLWGLDPVATAVAHRAAAALAGFAGVVCDAASYAQAMTRSGLYRAVVRQATSGADIFADPDEEPSGGSVLRVQLLAVRQGPEVQAAKRAASDALPGADLMEPAEEVSGGDAVCAAMLALRFELAALYLGLAAGTLGGPVPPAPVGA
ncbi:SIS domain-containing protein [Gandjariella thermophila]|uniref:Uncharacterized protein n=1 Tax=Gandjariella thermophila TaxID=1931992 RepID=A0A4D4JA71_9PSEU|nr:SIS domain-containing protein [Gandjariella thermophila]GDY31309.1 hypothetical protein GTS_29420 [Gandjariella thermophila]